MGESLNKLRRHDREVTDKDWIVAMLDRAGFGVLATCVDGQPFTVARNFAYDPERHAIYLHGARKGRTYENTGSGTRANLNVSEMGELIAAVRAMNFSVRYKGVVVFGWLSLVDDPAEARHGLCLLMEKHFPHLCYGEDYEGISDEDLSVTAVLRLDIESWSGKERL